MNREERSARPARISKIVQDERRPYYWPHRLPMLSQGAQAIVGTKTFWLLNALEKSAQIGHDGYAALDRGTFSWGKKLLHWELRAYDPHLLYRDFDYNGERDNNHFIFVLTAQEAQGNREQELTMIAEQRARYSPPKT